LTNVVEEARVHVWKEKRRCMRKSLIAALGLFVTVGIIIGIFAAVALFSKHTITSCIDLSRTKLSDEANDSTRYYLRSNRTGDSIVYTKAPGNDTAITIWNETLNETQSTIMSEVIENHLYFQH